jgi:hypothetical protein
MFNIFVTTQAMDVIAYYVRFSILTFFLHSFLLPPCHLLFSLYLSFVLTRVCVCVCVEQGGHIHVRSELQICITTEARFLHIFSLQNSSQAQCIIPTFEFQKSCDITDKECRVNAYYFQIFYSVQTVPRNGTQQHSHCLMYENPR